MKLSYFSPLLLIALAANAGAAVYIDDFNGLTTGPSQNIGGQGGWSINDSTNLVSFSIGWDNGTGAGVTTAAALGGLGAIPVEDTVGLSHGYGEELGRTTATFDFSIVDSTADSGSLRDEFAFSMYSGSVNIFSVVFTPLALDPAVTPIGSWDLSYYVSGAYAGSLFLQIPEDGTYSFSLDFKKLGLQTDVVLGVGNPDNPLIRNRTLALDSSQIVDRFGFEWITTEPGGGDNYMIIDNLSVVPEPTSALLVGLTGLAFVSNRRRRA